MTDEELARVLYETWNSVDDIDREWVEVAAKARKILTPKPPIASVPDGMRVEALRDAAVGRYLPFSGCGGSSKGR